MVGFLVWYLGASLNSRPAIPRVVLSRRTSRSGEWWYHWEEMWLSSCLKRFMVSRQICTGMNPPNAWNSAFTRYDVARWTIILLFGRKRRWASLTIPRRPFGQIDSADSLATKRLACCWQTHSDCRFLQRLSSRDLWHPLPLARQPDLQRRGSEPVRLNKNLGAIQPIAVGWIRSS